MIDLKDSKDERSRLSLSDKVFSLFWKSFCGPALRG